MTTSGAVKKGREAMPEVAAWVDELREEFGAERIDAAIAAGQQARREYLRRVQTVGQAKADLWLARQKFPAGSFWASENGAEIGVRRP